MGELVICIAILLAMILIIAQQLIVTSKRVTELAEETETLLFEELEKIDERIKKLEEGGAENDEQF